MDNKADFMSLAGLRPDGRRSREIRRVRCRFGVFKRRHAAIATVTAASQSPMPVSNLHERRHAAIATVTAASQSPMPVYLHELAVWIFCPRGRHRRNTVIHASVSKIHEGADGSAYLEMGQTKVIAIVKGPREVTRRQDRRHDEAIVHCEYNLAPFSGSERKQRRPTDRKSVEIAQAVKEVFEGAVMLHLYPRTQIDIYLHVVQSDGGVLPVGVNAASLALIDAGVAMSDLVVACSAGYLDGTPVMDLNYVEQALGGPYLPVAVLPAKDKILMAKMESRLPLEIFEEVLRAATDACQQVHNLLQAAVKEHASGLLSSQM